MADTVRMRHVTFHGDWMEYFYDGELPVKDAVIEVPVARPEWVRRAWVQGFQRDMNNKDIDDLDLYVDAEQARDAKEPDSNDEEEDVTLGAEVQNVHSGRAHAGTHARRQPTDQDRIRTSPAQGG